MSVNSPKNTDHFDIPNTHIPNPHHLLVAAPSSEDTFSSLSPSASCSSNNTLVNDRTLCLRDFKVLRCLGMGGHGAVYGVRDKTTRENMALKVVPKQGKRERQIRLLLAEQHTLSLLSEDPWCVSLQASWCDSQNFYFAMEIHPTTLQDVCAQQGIFPAPRARFYMAEMVVALNFLHSRGIIHRDIKPANLLLSRDGHIILADFGLAKNFHQIPTLDEQVVQPYFPYLRTDTPSPTTQYREPWELKFVVKASCGTPVYMAPEVFLGHPHAFGIDFWAAAVTLFRMLTGRMPWYAEDPRDTGLQVIYEALEINEGEMEPEAEDFLRKMLQKSSCDRLRSGTEMNSHPYFATTDWHCITTRTLPIPAEWLPVQQPSCVGGQPRPIVPGESYNETGDEDPYPEFCWTSERVKRGVVNVDAVDVEVQIKETKTKTVEEEEFGYAGKENKHKNRKGDVRVRVGIKLRLRFFGRLVRKMKIFGHGRGAKRERNRSESVTLFSLPSTPNLSFASVSDYVAS